MNRKVVLVSIGLFAVVFLNVVKADSTTVGIAVDNILDESILESNFNIIDQQSITAQSSQTHKKKKRRERHIRFLLSYDFSMSYDDNPRLAQESEDIRDDLISDAIFKVTTTYKLSKFTRLNLGIAAKTEIHDTFKILDNSSYEFNSKYIFISDSTYAAPVYILKFSLGGLDSNSVMRTSNFIKLGLNISKRLSSKIITTGGVQLEVNDSQSEVFDTNRVMAFVNTDFDLTRSSLLYFTYHFILGDTVSSATPSLNVVNAASAIEVDDAFGGIDLNQFAYKIDATTNVLTFGLNQFYSRAFSTDISFRYVQSESNDVPDLQYERTIFRAGILGRF